MSASANADQALAVPVEPASGLAPPGFDPSRERRIDFIPAFDKRSPDRSKDYGIGSMRIRFILIGPEGAVQWMIGTNWDVASARQPRSWRDEGKPVGWDLGYHSPRPLYEEQTPMGACDVLSGPCYYDGSGLNADLLIENFVSKGGDYAWAALEAYYRFTFYDAPWPFDDDGNLIASAIETQSATTAGRGPQDESAARQGDAKTVQP